MTPGFDSLMYAEALEQGGFTPVQSRSAAHALGQAIDTQLASMAALTAVEDKLTRKIDEVETRLTRKIDDLDIRLNLKIDNLEVRLNHKIDDLAIRLDHKIDDLEVRLDHKIDDLEVRLRHEIVESAALLRVDMGKLKSELIMWMVGVLFVQSGIVAVLFKFLR